MDMIKSARKIWKNTIKIGIYDPDSTKYYKYQEKGSDKKTNEVKFKGNHFTHQ